jgi:hypothetical protein
MFARIVGTYHSGAKIEQSNLADIDPINNNAPGVWVDKTQQSGSQRGFPCPVSRIRMGKQGRPSDLPLPVRPTSPTLSRALILKDTP